MAILTLPIPVQIGVGVIEKGSGAIDVSGDEPSGSGFSNARVHHPPDHVSNGLRGNRDGNHTPQRSLPGGVERDLADTLFRSQARFQLSRGRKMLFQHQTREESH